ncbi:MAG TPA: hypothetical protein VLC09_21340 [Polyangiaceae bacterium]|nr:hypothetical protein [Polyangiaceae bacterium]
MPRRSTRSSRLLGLVALSALALGCRSQPKARFPTAERALARLAEQNACSHAVQGEASLAFSGDGRRLNGTVLFMANQPESLRLDVFSSLGATITTLTSDGSTFGLYNLPEKSFVYGPARTCNVRRFTQVPVPPRSLVGLFRGLPPVLESQKTSIRYDAPWFSPGSYVLGLDASNAHQEIRLGVHPDDYEQPVERQRLRLLRVVTKRGDEVLYEVDLRGHAAAQNAPISQSEEEKAMGVPPPEPSGPPCQAELPRETRFYVPASGYQLSFQTKEVWHNPPLTPATFQQPVPGGVTLQESNCSD